MTTTEKEKAVKILALMRATEPHAQEVAVESHPGEWVVTVLFKAGSIKAILVTQIAKEMPDEVVGEYLNAEVGYLIKHPERIEKHFQVTSTSTSNPNLT